MRYSKNYFIPSGLLTWALINLLCLLIPFHKALQADAQPFPQNSYQQGQVQQSAADMAAARQAGPNNVMIILDASYSMSEHLGRDESKMAVAKRVIMDVLQRIPPNTRVGFRVFGQSDNEFMACHATKLLVPLAYNNRNLIASQLISIHPTGATPISYTLIQTVNNDFQGVNGKRSIILITDGMETCSSDPCEVAVAMVRQNVDVKVNVVGFGMQPYDEAAKQLKCIAMATYGKFATANTAAELANSLNQTLQAEEEVQGRILPTAPQPVKYGTMSTKRSPSKSPTEAPYTPPPLVIPVTPHH